MGRPPREQIHQPAQHFLPILPVEGQGQLGSEQAVLDANVVAMRLQLAGQVALAFGQLRQGGASDARCDCPPALLFAREHFHDRRGQDVHAEETKVVAGPQARDNQPLLGLGGGGLLQHLGDLIKALARRHQAPANRAVIGQLALVRRLHGRDGAILHPRDLDQLLRGALGAAADVKMVADQQQERLGAGKFTRATHRVAVAERRRLLDEVEPAALPAGGSGISGFVPGADDHTDFLDAGREDFLDENPQRGLGGAVAVHQGLQGEGPLGFAGGGDDGFLDFHGFRTVRCCARRQQRCKMPPHSQLHVGYEVHTSILAVGRSFNPRNSSRAVRPWPPVSAEAPFDYFQNSWSVIGLKDYNDGTRITPQNELVLADNARLRFSCGPRLTPLSRKQTKTLLDGWLPVVLLNTEEDGVRYEFTFWATPLPTVKDWRAAFAWPTEGENFLNWVRVKATNPGPAPPKRRCASTCW